MRRKSASEKKLQGTYQPYREKKRLQFETANGVEIKAPAFVRANKLAHAEWKSLIPHLLSENVLRQTDISILANYCLTYSKWRQAALDVETNGQTILVTSSTRTGSCTKPVINPSVRTEILYSACVKIGTKLGLNPLDRSRIETPEAEDDGRDPFEKFLDGDDDDPELAYLELPRNKQN
jgi:P27 family predicted phage terminase small subunit